MCGKKPTLTGPVTSGRSSRKGDDAVQFLQPLSFKPFDLAVILFEPYLIAGIGRAVTWPL